MGLSVKKGTFSAATSTGDQSVTGVGFQGKALLVWGLTRTATGYSVGPIRFFFGCATGTATEEEWCASIGIDESAATSNTARDWRDTAPAVISIINGGQTQEAIATFVSWDSDGFTINWSDAPSSAWVIHYMVIGGTDVSAQAAIVDIPSALGNQAYTGAGFQPKAVLIGSTLTNVELNTQANICIGVSDGTRQASTAFRDRDAQATMQTSGAQVSDSIVNGLSSTADSIALNAALVSLDSDGMTLDWNAGGVSIPDGLGVLYLGGTAQYWAGVETQKTTTGTKSTTVGFPASAVFGFSWNQAASASVSSTAKVTIGGSDGSTEGHVWYQSADASANSDTDVRHETTKFLGMATQASTTNAECDASFSGNDVVLDWTTADGTAREFAMLAIGAASGATLSGAVGVVAWTGGSPVALNTQTAPAITVAWTGGTPGIRLPAAVSTTAWTSGTHTLRQLVDWTSAAVAWTGGTPVLRALQSWTAAAVAWTGNAPSLAAILSASAGTTAWTGGTPILRTLQDWTAAAVAWSGNAPALSSILSASSGLTVWTGGTHGYTSGNTFGVPAATTAWTGGAPTLASIMAASTGAVAWTQPQVTTISALQAVAAVVSWVQPAAVVADAVGQAIVEWLYWRRRRRF